ncbi:MAG: DUF58 domain-containing protein [Candidatus Omnitrophota bacterium]
MIPKEILKKIREIEIKTSQKVTEVFAGCYESVFKGRGMEFDEVREYQPGDEIRSIDWNVTARMGKPYIKRFVEERELCVMLLLDASLSCKFGTRGRLKIDLAAEVSSVLAFSAITNNDKVGMIIFTDRIEKFVYPQKGTEHVLRLIRDTLCFVPKGKKTDISVALQFLDKMTTRKAVCFIISDFFAPDYKKALSIANKKHDIIAIKIADPAEEAFTDVGILQLQDAETGKDFLIDTSNPRLMDKYKKDAQSNNEKQKQMFSTINIDSINLHTDVPYVDSLIKFFSIRQSRLAGK